MKNNKRPSFYLFSMCKVCNSLNITKVSDENICFVCRSELPLLNLMSAKELQDFTNTIQMTVHQVVESGEK